MKAVLSCLDVACVIRELQVLAGSFIDKIFHVGDEFIFHFSGKRILRVVIGRLIHLSSFVKENPMVPSNFCMFLRKYLKGGRLVSVSQVGFERVVCLRVSKGGVEFLVFFELFSTGNVIVADSSNVILQCLRTLRFSARTVKRGVSYSLPPSSYDFSVPDFVNFRGVIRSSSKSDLVRALASDIGLGGAYAEEVCLIAGLDKLVSPSVASESIIQSCFDVVNDLIKRVRYGEVSPLVVLVNDSPFDAVPFPLRFYEGKQFRSFSSFNEALDFFYSKSEVLSASESRFKVFDAKRAKLLSKLESAENYVNELISNASVVRGRALSLKSNLFTIERVISSLISARRNNYSWDDIKLMLEREQLAGSFEALLVKELRPDDNLIVLDVDGGVDVPLNGDFRVFLDDLFSQAKKFDSKIDGARVEVDRLKAELESLSLDSIKVEVNIPKRVDVSGKEWFERFKWFRTGEGLLVVSGRDALQNEELVRKYLSPDDLVFHADIHGSPFSILRNGRSASEASKLEAAQFTGVHSSAWSKGVSPDVYFVLPFQVDKEAPSGEFLSTGGFMIHGKKSFIKSVILELCVGVSVIDELSYRLISGPCSAIKGKCVAFLTLRPGDLSVSEAVHKIIDYFKVKGFVFDFEAVRAALPSGSFNVK